MALSIGFRIISFLPSCYSSYGALDSYPGGTLTHCSCQPSLDAHFSGLIRPIVRIADRTFPIQATHLESHRYGSYLRRHIGISVGPTDSSCCVSSLAVALSISKN